MLSPSSRVQNPSESYGYKRDSSVSELGFFTNRKKERFLFSSGLPCHVAARPVADAGSPVTVVTHERLPSAYAWKPVMSFPFSV